MDKAKSISIITIGVKDIEKSVAFYQKLGFKYSKDSDKACTYMVSSNIVLGLLQHDVLSNEMGLEYQKIPKYNGVLLSINGKNSEEVDLIFNTAINAGAYAHQKPCWKDWDGKKRYSGFIVDPDDHMWEIAYATALDIDENCCIYPKI